MSEFRARLATQNCSRSQCSSLCAPLPVGVELAHHQEAWIPGLRATGQVNPGVLVTTAREEHGPLVFFLLSKLASEQSTQTALSSPKQEAAFSLRTVYFLNFNR